jgi:hypothetical protein
MVYFCLPGITPQFYSFPRIPPQVPTKPTTASKLSKGSWMHSLIDGVLRGIAAHDLSTIPLFHLLLFMTSTQMFFVDTHIQPQAKLLI